MRSVDPQEAQGSLNMGWSRPGCRFRDQSSDGASWDPADSQCCGPPANPESESGPGHQSCILFFAFHLVMETC